MMKNLNFWKITFCAIFFSILACREELEYTKIQQEQTRVGEFFRNNDVNGKSQNATLISNSIEKLKSINEKTDFLSTLSDKTGLPVWNYLLNANTHSDHNHGTANKGNEEATETLVIPLRQEDNFLSSVMYVENPDSENPAIYTVTNEQLEEFVNNESIDKSIRENVLMTFVYFDHETFGERRYSSIPEDLFESVPLKEGLDYKSFSVENTEVTTTSNKQVMVCIDTYHCVGCIGPCDGCPMCVSTSCTTLGTPGPNGPSNPGTPGGDGNSGGSGGDGNPNTPTVPWYLMNPNVNIYSYNANVRNVFKKVTDFNIVLEKEQLDYLNTRSEFAGIIYSYLTNNTVHKSQSTYEILEHLAQSNANWNIYKPWFQNQALTANLTFNPYLNSTNSISFSTFADFHNAISSKNNNLVIENSITQVNATERIIGTTIKRTGLWGSGLEVRVKIRKNENLWEFDSVNSSEFGITLGTFTFNQIDYTKTVSNNITYLDVIGYENWNVFIEGIGTYYKDKVMIKLKINNITGQIIPPSQFVDLQN